MISDCFKRLALENRFLRILVSQHLEKKGILIPKTRVDEFLNEAEVVRLPQHNMLDKGLKVGLVKDGEHNFDGFLHRRHDYVKYRRFLENNKIEYDYFDPRLSTWIKDVDKFDVVIWRPDSDLHKQHLSKRQIYFIEKVMKKIIYPSYKEVWSYEEKINTHFLSTYFELPEIPSFYSSSYQECILFIEKCRFPIISKINTGSSSFGVEKLKNKRIARSFIRSVFSPRGRKTYWPFQRQKDYVLFQEFVAEAHYDLRVIVIGDMLFGYYRYAKAGDFRASGSGIVEKKEIPFDVLELAYKVKQCYGALSLATDFLFSAADRKFYIIESSIFIGVDSCEQLSINGISGYYKRVSPGVFLFEAGRFWIQELVLKEFFLSGLPKIELNR